MSLDDLKIRIKETPISEVISRYISVQKKSSNFISLCPFHNDSKPSMHINNSMGIYKCFACEASGDSITFVREYKHLEYIEALKELSQQLGLNFDDYNDAAKKISPKEIMMKKLLVTSNQIFVKLAETQPEHFQHFLKERNLTAEIASKFSIGLTTKANILTNYLESISDKKKREDALRCAVELVLIKPSTHDNQSHYDTFRERIIFPIWDQFGHVVGFGGRDYGGRTPAKYLNSSDSMLFKKSNHLYGLNFAKSSIREHNRVLIVEGYMDVVSLHRYGFTNSVAVMGVALGEKRALTLKNITPNIYLGLDSDTPGFKAMQRINQELLSIGILPRHVSYTPAKDPDDFLKLEGKLKMQERLEEAPLFLDVEVDHIIKTNDISGIDQKLITLHNIFKLLIPLGTSLMATELAIKYAKQLGINSTAEQIGIEFSDYIQQQKDRAYIPPRKKEAPAPLQPHEPELPQPKKAVNKKMTVVEKMLVEELVSHPEAIKTDKITKILDLSSNNDVKQFVWELKEFLLEIDDSQYHNLVMGFASGDRYPLEIQQAVSTGLFSYLPLKLNDKVIDRIFADLEFRLKEEQVLHKKQDLLSRKKTSRTTDEKETIMKQLHQLDKDLHQLKKEHQKR